MLRYLFVLSLVIRLGSLSTDRPIIGIMTMELEDNFVSLFPGYDSYLAASYVKVIESSGARVVPVFTGRSEAYYKHVAESVNGIIFPGGGARFDGTDNFYAASKLMYQAAIEANKNKRYFPILGVCLGFELLLHFANNDVEIRKSCQGLQYKNLPLNFVPGFKKSSLYVNMPKRILKALKTNITINNHVWCIYPEDFNQRGLQQDWKILSTSTDQNGVEFISSIEHKKYPIAGVQFHPEKNIFEWKKELNFPHSEIAIASSRYFYDWFVRQARLNQNSFTSSQREKDNLIYNYVTSYSDLYNLSFTQTYFFRTKYLNNE